MDHAQLVRNRKSARNHVQLVLLGTEAGPGQIEARHIETKVLAEWTGTQHDGRSPHGRWQLHVRGNECGGERPASHQFERPVYVILLRLSHGEYNGFVDGTLFTAYEQRGLGNHSEQMRQ